MLSSVIGTSVNFAEAASAVINIGDRKPGGDTVGGTSGKSGNDSSSSSESNSTGDAATDTARDLVKDILIIVYNIVRIVGIIFIIIGLVKFVIAHANEQGPEQQKAAMMMATGVVLVLLPTILGAMKLYDKVTPIKPVQS